MTESIGFIGLGLMGQPMAMNLVKAGHPVKAFNRTRQKAEPLARAGAVIAGSPAEAARDTDIDRAGAVIAGSPAEAARDTDIVFTIVSDTAALEEVALGKDGFLEAVRPGAVVIDSSTISPAFSRKLACLIAGKGASLLDAPGTRSKHGAE